MLFIGIHHKVHNHSSKLLSTLRSKCRPYIVGACAGASPGCSSCAMGAIWGFRCWAQTRGQKHTKGPKTHKHTVTVHANTARIHFNQFNTVDLCHLCVKIWFVKKRDGHSVLLRVGVDDTVCSWQVAVVGQHAQHVTDVAHKRSRDRVGSDPLPSCVFDLQCSHVWLLVDQRQ